MTATATTVTTRSVDAAPRPPREIRPVHGRGDQVFHHGARIVGVVVLAIFGAIGVFLGIRAFQALTVAKWNFLTTQAWQPSVHRFGIAAVLLGTALIALVAVSVATPLSLGMALFITEIAPNRLRRILVGVVDLMAAIPSIIFGLWGKLWLQAHVIGVSRWISTWFGWIPIFHVPGADPTNPLASSTVYTAGTFMAGLVVAIMIAPTQCAIMREVFSRAPLGEREGAYALGSTRWTMVRNVVLPYGKGGVIGGTMLGLGRALGETITVLTILSINAQNPQSSQLVHILGSGGISVSSLIATLYSESTPFGVSALMAAGLALFLITLGINFTAASVVKRSRSGAQSDA